MSRPVRRYLLLTLAIALIGYLLYRSRTSLSSKAFDWHKVTESLSGARISLLLLALGMIYVCYAIRALRWMRFSRTLGKLHFWNVYRAQLMGFSCLSILGRPGEPVRPVLVALKDSISIARMFGVWVLERVFDIASTVVLAGFALLMFERRGLIGDDEAVFMGRARVAGVVLLALLVALCSVLVYFRYHGGAWLSRRLQHENWRHGWRAKMAALLEGFSEGLQGIRTWGDLGVLIFYTVAHWLLVALAYEWIVHAFGGDLGDIGYTGAVLILALTMVGSSVQLPVVGGGSIHHAVANHFLGCVRCGRAVASARRMVSRGFAAHGAGRGASGAERTFGGRGACRGRFEEAVVMRRISAPEFRHFRCELRVRILP